MPRISKAERLREARATKLPYGRWVRICDGAECLHDREYRSLWQRTAGGPAVPFTPAGDGLMRRGEWFYNDATPEQDRVAAGVAVLKAWGLPIPDEFRK